MSKFIFDSNAFDKVVDGEIELKTLQNNKNQYFATHIQMDELSRTKDKIRRKNLLDIFQKIKQTELPTESIVLGISRYGHAKYGDGVTLEKLRKGKIKETSDSLIGEVGIKKKLILVTEDKTFRKKVNKCGGQAISFEEFKEMLK
jgi:predicted nucleic acid-binding protein